MLEKVLDFLGSTSGTASDLLAVFILVFFTFMGTAGFTLAVLFVLETFWGKKK